MLCRKSKKKFEFLAYANFVGNASLENSTNYLFGSDFYVEDFCKSKNYVVFAASKCSRGLSTIYKKRNLLHGSTVGWDVEGQNTQILFSSDQPVLCCMSVTTLSAQMAFGSKLVERCRDATSSSNSDFLVDLSPRTDHFTVKRADKFRPIRLFPNKWNSKVFGRCLLKISLPRLDLLVFLPV